MKSLLRTFLYLSLIVWLGAEIFFPIVAAVAFSTLRPDTHAAGLIVRQLLVILHGIGLVAGMVAMALLAIAPAWSIYRARMVLFPMIMLLAMIVLTAYTQFDVMPAMERDRIAAGGIIDAASAANPDRVDFQRLHNRSEHVEEAIVLLGLGTVIMIARAETLRA